MSRLEKRANFSINKPVRVTSITKPKGRSVAAQNESEEEKATIPLYLKNKSQIGKGIKRSLDTKSNITNKEESTLIK